MTKYESQIYTINVPQEVAYTRIADLRYFETLKNAFSDPEKINQVLQQIPEAKGGEEKIADFRKNIEKMTFTEDTLSAETEMGTMTLAIVQREAPKLVKLETQGAPVAATVWLQLLPKGTEQSALKVTVGASLNFFIRKMVEKHLKQAPDGIASFLSQVLSAR